VLVRGFEFQVYGLRPIYDRRDGYSAVPKIMEPTMADRSQFKTDRPSRLSWRDVNGLAFVILALGATIAFATLTEANYRAEDAKMAAAKAEQVRVAAAEARQRAMYTARQLSFARAVAGQQGVNSDTKTLARCDYSERGAHDVAS
jgi:hypothetical protein